MVACITSSIHMDKHEKRLLEGMKSVGVLPREEALLAASDLYKAEIVTHHGMPSPVIFRSGNVQETAVSVHLQCLAGIHYNPARAIAKSVSQTNPKFINTTEENLEINIQPEKLLKSLKRMIAVEEEEEINFKCDCGHTDLKFGTYPVSIADTRFCGLVDTGAQVSLITEATLNKIKGKDQRKTKQNVRLVRDPSFSGDNQKGLESVNGRGLYPPNEEEEQCERMH